MNFLRTFSALFILTFSQFNAQTIAGNTQKPADHPTRCSNIKEGTFLRINYPKNLWYMTVKDNVQTEFYNEGKDYVKASMVFLDDCNYKLVILENTQKDESVDKGKVFTNKIIATQDRYIKIQTQMEGSSPFDLVLVKAKENKK